MRKYLSTFLLLWLVQLANAQNYIGTVGVYGPMYATATTIGSTGSPLVGITGLWLFGGVVTSVPKSSANGVTFNGGTYLGASSTAFVDGYVNQVGSAAFTFPVGDATATAGDQYHPLSITAPSAATTVSTSYNASSTPNTGNLSGVGAVDPSAYWTFGNTTSGATSTVSIAIRDVSAVFGASSNISVVGYNTTTNNWEVAGPTTTPVVGGQTLSSNAIDLTTYSAFTVGKSNAATGLLVNIKVLLQGAISGASMTTSLHSFLPLAQPYTASPFGYPGTESIATVPASMTDWVLVDLRDATTPTTIVATRAALLMSNGTVTDLDGTSPVSFPTQATGNYYVGIRHRNHLAIRSSSALALSGVSMSYDFTTAQANAYQNSAITTNAAMKDFGNGIFAMWAGNVNGNTQVRYGGPNNDESALLSGCLGGNTSTILTSVYSNCDLNMNGTVRYGAGGNDETFLLSTVLGGKTSAIFTNHL